MSLFDNQNTELVPLLEHELTEREARILSNLRNANWQARASRRDSMNPLYTASFSPFVAPEVEDFLTAFRDFRVIQGPVTPKPLNPFRKPPRESNVLITLSKTDLSQLGVSPNIQWQR